MKKSTESDSVESTKEEGNVQENSVGVENSAEN